MLFLFLSDRTRKTAVKQSTSNWRLASSLGIRIQSSGRVWLSRDALGVLEGQKNQPADRQRSERRPYKRISRPERRRREVDGFFQNFRHCPRTEHRPQQSPSRLAARSVGGFARVGALRDR